MTEEELKLRIAIQRAKREREMTHAAPAPKPAREMATPEQIEARKAKGSMGLPALGYGIMRGLTRNGDDEIAAYLTDADVEETRANRKAAKEASPYAHGFGEIVGALLGGAAPMVGALRAARGAGLGRQMGIGAGVGATEAITQGFLDGEGGIGNRLEKAYNPLAIGLGAGIGAGVPLAAAGARKIAGMGRDNVAARAAGYSKPAVGEVSKRLDDDAAVRDIEGYLDRLGPNATLADAGPSMRNLAGGAAAELGPARSIVVNAMERRAAGAPDRLASGIDETLGPRMNMEGAREALRAAQSREAREAYDAFNATNVPLTPELRAMIAQADNTGALAYTRQVAAARGVNFDPATYLDPNATEISGEALDLISRALRDRSRKAWRDGEGALGEAMGDLNTRFIDAAPGLRGIRARYADQMSIREAAEDGADLLSGKITPDAFNARWANMSEAERAAFRASARDAIEQKMANSAFETNAGLRALGPRSVQAKIDTAFGEGAAFDIDRLIRSEKAMRDTANRTIANSETAGRESAKKVFAPPTDADGLPRGPVAAAKRKIGQAWQATAESMRGTTRENVNRDIARMLTAKGEERDRLVDALMRDQLTRQNREARAIGTEDLVRLLLSGAPAAAALQAN